jgi:hypothetical protein
VGSGGYTVPGWIIVRPIMLRAQQVIVIFCVLGGGGGGGFVRQIIDIRFHVRQGKGKVSQLLLRDHVHSKFCWKVVRSEKLLPLLWDIFTALRILLLLDLRIYGLSD